MRIHFTDPRDLSLIERTRKEQPEKSQLEILKMLASNFPKGAVTT